MAIITRYSHNNARADDRYHLKNVMSLHANDAGSRAGYWAPEANPITCEVESTARIMARKIEASIESAPCARPVIIAPIDCGPGTGASMPGPILMGDG